jgi:hypothetical protein
MRGGSVTVFSVSRSLPCLLQSLPGHAKGNRFRVWKKSLGILAATLFLAPLLLAQGSPQVTGVDPAAGKVSDSVTVSGQNLGKGSVAAVYLSDDKTDNKATVVEQAADKIVIKVPKVKAGNYNISIQIGNQIMILPVRFEVQEDN